MAEEQVSTVRRVRRQGSSGYYWDDEMLSSEPQQKHSLLSDDFDFDFDFDQGESRSQMDGQDSSTTTITIHRDPPSPRDPTCGLCMWFFQVVKNCQGSRQT
ncbi:unnamed protein product [Lactuca virosa]|uniref:Uncharacterized protein n=1 Tax=Lactuca virosa TaxID=75947 RepID=A0AAU9MGL2_9ASTR|nr:unnamed protein product [Lactuca virosa]